ncbi:MAG: ferrous iron transport protein B [Planctomycetia bacterium]|nr:ferrous iron transport protein B [Planctomycetia bacterium]
MKSPTIARSTITVALIGNPNTGKSTLFTALAGVRQRVGNYPGVTVEKKLGSLHLSGQACQVVDLPGTYSLAPRSPDEMVAVDVLLGRRADVGPIDIVLSIVDASNLERNLYLVSQVLELGVPTVVALNMVDIARARGLAIDVERLSTQLNVPVVEVQANRHRGIAELKAALVAAISSNSAVPESPFPTEFQREVTHLQSALAPRMRDEESTCGGEAMPRYLVERLLLDTSGYLQSELLGNHHSPGEADVAAELKAARGRLAAAGSPVPAVEAQARYAWVAQVLKGVIARPAERVTTRSDRIDRILTNKFWGTLLFVLAMLLVFSSVFVAAEPAMKAIDAVIGKLGQAVGAAMSEGPLESLLVDGVIGGVGSVLVFLPQILMLFFFLAILEDCGYMARAAYLMDKLMVRVGLSGKSFIPLLSSFACAIPGVMATRVIENRRDRLTTILVAPLMSCSARLPVYTVLIGAFIPRRTFAGGLLQLQGVTLFTLYLLGIVTAALVALVLKKTLLRGPTPPFVMELPSYKWPSPSTVLYRMGERGWSFVRRAGTLILAVSVIVWAASYYPHNAEVVEENLGPERDALTARLVQLDTGAAERAGLEDQKADMDHAIAAAYQRQSILGRMGRTIEPAVRPLGWDWRIGCAVIASFPAREVVMGALGVIYNLGKGLDVGDQTDQDRLAARMHAARWDDSQALVYNIPVALSIMVFFALCAQCASTLVVIRRETNSWRWPAFTFIYMTALAYLGALVTYQVGMRLPPF